MMNLHKIVEKEGKKKKKKNKRSKERLKLNSSNFM